MKCTAVLAALKVAPRQTPSRVQAFLYCAVALKSPLFQQGPVALEFLLVLGTQGIRFIGWLLHQRVGGFYWAAANGARDTLHYCKTLVLQYNLLFFIFLFLLFLFLLLLLRRNFNQQVTITRRRRRIKSVWRGVLLSSLQRLVAALCNFFGHRKQE